jgi:hypothetical protein
MLFCGNDADEEQGEPGQGDVGVVNRNGIAGLRVEWLYTVIWGPSQAVPGPYLEAWLENRDHGKASMTAKIIGRPGMTAKETEGPTVRPYEPSDRRAWDNLVDRSCNGVFLHSQNFLSYHGDRFRDNSMIIENHRGRIVGVFPAAADPNDQRLIVSHPGLTYGGAVHDGSVTGGRMIRALERITSHYRDLGYLRLRYKAVPTIYHSMPASDDIYALFRLGARRYRSDLGVAIDLANRPPVRERRLHSRRRATRAGVSTAQDWNEVAAFWKILELNLDRRHGASPVHSLEQILLLHDRFPGEIILIAAKIGELLVGGSLLFSAGPVLKLQYSATTEEGRVACATDSLMEHAIELACHRSCRFFDFGTCTLDEGRLLGEDLYQFKASFGAGGVVYDHYELDLL